MKHVTRRKDFRVPPPHTLEKFLCALLAPTNKSFLRWFQEFKETGCLSEKKSSGQPSLGKSCGECEAEFCSKSTGVASRKFGMPQKTAWKT
ncbi:hypothetical protein TNCV_3123361 [Trichonephila clavipes]|nr:hypothetical protein TNCV_3123361 [Trichonephila clavipes]